jgi:hypothetical protein
VCRTNTFALDCLWWMVQAGRGRCHMRGWWTLSAGDVLNSVHVTAACTRRTVARHGMALAWPPGAASLSCRPGVREWSNQMSVPHRHLIFACFLFPGLSLISSGWIIIFICHCTILDPHCHFKCVLCPGIRPCLVPEDKLYSLLHRMFGYGVLNIDYLWN